MARILTKYGEFKAFIDEMSTLYRQQYPGRQPLGTWQKFLRDHGMKELMDKLSAEYRGQVAPAHLHQLKQQVLVYILVVDVDM